MPTPVPFARRDVILQRLAAGRPIVVVDVAKEFGVSEASVRRDVRELAAQGLCRKAYGGALPLAPHTTTAQGGTALVRARDEALARRAVTLIAPGEMVFLDDSGASRAITQFLPSDHGVTIVTNSVAVAALVMMRSDVELILLGGSIDRHLGGSVDAFAVQVVGQLRINRCIFGGCGVDVVRGVVSGDRNEALLKRAVVQASKDCVVMAGNEAFATRAPHLVCALVHVHLFIVEHDAPTRSTDDLAFGGASLVSSAA